MFRTTLMIAALLSLTACGLNAEQKAMKQRYLNACLEDQHSGACQVLAADAIARGQGNAAAMKNWTAATNNTANWAVQQQRVPAYTGGSVQTCSANPLTGVKSCY